MHLAYRILLTLAVTTGALFVGNAALLHGIVSREFQQLETQAALRNAQRALHAVAGNLAQLQASTLDWALWDSAHGFMLGIDREDFIKENLVLQSFQGIGVELMYFISPAGRVVWGEQYDLSAEERRPASTALVGALIDTACGQTDECGPLPARSGFLSVGDTMLMVAAAPVLRADGSGPPAGTLIMGRELTESLVEQLGNQVQVAFTLEPLGEAPAAVPAPAGEGASRFHVQAVDDGYLRVRTTLPDFQGEPLLELEALLERSISRSGRAMANYGLALSAIMLLATGGLTLWMLRRQVLRPVAALLGRVQMARGATPEALAGGGDELEVLAAEFESTFRQLEDTRHRLTEQSFYTGMAELAGGMTHNLRNTLTPISVRLWRLQALTEDGLLTRLQAAAEMLPDVESDQRAAMATKYLRVGLAEAAGRAGALAADVQVMTGQIEQVERILADHQAFTRSGRKLEAVEVASVISSAARLLASGGTARLIRKGLHDLPRVYGHSIILAQVFGNVLINAEEAILAAGRGPGIITVCGRLMETDDRSFVEIEVTDTGQGIAMENIDRVFERGFSTKRVGTGGIGLHWCANTLASMGGAISVSSPGPGQGATVTVRLRPCSGSTGVGIA
ncbi:sensor histidine kinase [Indioceanicola profundi]|uniref:sensor histidine kinase n=1 Tax=Indioceanicola profundi TaxID=2220096 RepID=UPI0013C522CF|nr:CHASE4 domain-containing protein [Indioceanicola profundi]